MARRHELQRVGARTLTALVVALAAAACGQNPVLGDWEIDPAESERGAVTAAEATGLSMLTLRADAIVTEDIEIPVSYIVERDRVVLVREDGLGEHAIELLPDDRIRIELPIRVSAVYRRAGS